MPKNKPQCRYFIRFTTDANARWAGYKSPFRQCERNATSFSKYCWQHHRLYVRLKQEGMI